MTDTPSTLRPGAAYPVMKSRGAHPVFIQLKRHAVLIARAGETLGKFGSVILIASASCIVLVPLGIAIGLPVIILGATLYYGGSWLSGDKPGLYPSP